MNFAIIGAPWIARKELDGFSLVSLPPGRRKLQRNWGILHWRGKHLALAEETFIGLCETATAPLRQWPITAAHLSATLNLVHPNPQ